MADGETELEPEIDMELVRGLAGFRRSLRAFLAASEGLSKAAGVTSVQYQAMLAICAWEGPMALRDLADELMLTHSAAVQMVDRLEAAGLAQRDAGEDRRVVLVSLTPEGGALLSDLARGHLQEVLRCERDLARSARRLRAFR